MGVEFVSAKSSSDPMSYTSEDFLLVLDKL